MTDLVYPPIVLIEWEDATNIPTWTDLKDIPEFAETGGFICRSVGYLVYEDAKCVVVASRISLVGTPEQVGLYERIPKGVILKQINFPTLYVGEGQYFSEMLR